MSPAAVRKAKAEAQEFVKRANVVLARDEEHYYWPSKDTAALRRQSMELTRALTEMRRFQR